jgi:hypothetical protein
MVEVEATSCSCYFSLATLSRTESVSFDQRIQNQIWFDPYELADKIGGATSQ